MIKAYIDVVEMMKSKVDSGIFPERYEFHGDRVPRTTEILSSMLHEEGLMSWANSLGFKRIGYRAYLNEAANKGTYTHNAIEHFLKNGQELSLSAIPELAHEATTNAYLSFRKWWDMINEENEVEVLAVEKKLACKYFGGTLDCLLRINGKLWLIDFKTSNHVNYKYCLQMASYIYMLKEVEDITVDGVIILQLDKHRLEFHEHVYQLWEPEDGEFMKNCIQEFLLLVAAYYGRNKIEKDFREINKGR